MKYPWIKEGVVIFKYVLLAQFVLALIIGFITNQLPAAFLLVFLLSLFLWRLVTGIRTLQPHAVQWALPPRL